MLCADAAVGAQYPDTWDEPDANFEAFVADTVRHRVGKYTQPDHPARISQADARSIFGKVGSLACAQAGSCTPGPLTAACEQPKRALYVANCVH